MNKKQASTAIVFLVLAILFVALMVLWPGKKSPAPPGPADGEKPLVAATIFPVYDVLRGVAGDELKVSLILPAGASPHTFEPSTNQMSGLQGAVVVYTAGNGVDGWAEGLAKSTGASLKDVSHGIELIKGDDGIGHEGEDEREEEAGHGHDGVNPHYWLSAGNIEVMADNIEADLAQRWPELTDEFSKNGKAYLQTVAQADHRAQELLSEAENKHLITLHDAWPYFAERYGLEIAGTFAPSAGREPTPKYLAELTAAVKQTGVKVVYSEPQLSTDALRPFLNDLDLDVAILDPLGGVPGRDSLALLIAYNAQIIFQNQ